MKTALVLTFHRLKLEATLSGASLDPASEHYTVTVRHFEQTMKIPPPEICCTASEFVNKTKGNWLILTFDDGLISDFEIAYPILIAKGHKATFFITAENVGHPGYTNVEHLKEMAKAGMEIGSHGLTHRYLVTMPRTEAVREIRESKERLEQEIGVTISSFAPVGGHFRKWMLDLASEAGYKAFATMIPGRTWGGKNLVLLWRNHIQAHHDATYISRLLNGDRRTLILNRLQYYLLSVPKTILGMRNYDRSKGFLFMIFPRVRSLSLDKE